MARLTTAERNRRKRERKKRERAAEREKQKEAVAASVVKTEEVVSDASGKDEVDVEVEYVPEPLLVGAASITVTATATADEVTSGATGGSDATMDDANDGGGGSGIKTEEAALVDINKGASTDATQEHSPTGGGGGGEADSENRGGEADPMIDLRAAVRAFQKRAAVVSDAEGGDEKEQRGLDDEEGSADGASDEEDEDKTSSSVSKRKLREKNRPTVSQLKQRVARSDLVEAHDVTASDPEFLLALKSVPNTVPVPRHWGRKRKYLQGKRGIEKAPFQLPDFIAKTGIAEVRGAAAAEEEKQSLKQKQRSRVAPRGGVDVDYKVLHDAFFRYQHKPKTVTKFGDLYYEGKEFEQKSKKDRYVPGQLSDALREALGMGCDNSPPPWLINMQRYGPPPSYPNLKIPGLNAPLPEGCSYGYHVNGWGKPPVDAYGRGLYGDVFGKPTSSSAQDDEAAGGDLITSDGKAVSAKSFWGALPTPKEGDEAGGADVEGEESSSEDESFSEEEESEGEEPEVPSPAEGGVPPPPPPTPAGGGDSVVPTSALDLRKTGGVAGEETPVPGGAPPQPKQLYQVLEATQAEAGNNAGAIFKSEVAYRLPGAAATADTEGDIDGAESVLSKAPSKRDEAGKRKRGGDGEIDDEDEVGDLGKKFKF